MMIQPRFSVLLCVAVIALIGCQKKAIQPLDYSLASNWMFQAPINHEVDLFYLYPTSVSPTCLRLVSPVNETMKERAYVSYLQNAECFSSYTNVFAPYYRQLGMRGILKCKTPTDLIELDRANEPWSDVKAALDYYFTYLNTDRPVILASHSQGSAVMHIVVDTYLREHPELKERIVAIYALGFQITQEWCDSVDMPFATGEEDTGVILTWNTEGAGCTGYNLPIAGGSLVINPLTWTRDTIYAGIEMNLGSLATDENGILIHVSGRADAQLNLARGVVVCTTDSNTIHANPIFGKKSFHFEDGALFYENMKENGQKRIHAYLTKS